MRGYIAQGLAVLVLIAGSGAAQRPDNSGLAITRNPAIAKVVPAKQAKPYEVGTASWYGSDFEGKTTANGESFNMFDLTAAHPALPLGSYVQVTNLRNRKAVVVRINDRGPVVPGRIIDLSYSAAKALQFSHKGLQRVRLDVVHPDVVAKLDLNKPVAYQR